MGIPFFSLKLNQFQFFFSPRKKKELARKRSNSERKRESIGDACFINKRSILTSESKMSKSYTAWQDYEWLMEEGADEKLQREVEEELRLAELERLMMQEEQASGDIQMMNQMTNLTMRTSQPPIKSRLNVNAPVFVPSWEQKA